MRLIKTLALNITIFFALMFVLMLVPPMYQAVKTHFAPQTSALFQNYAEKPALRDYDWAVQSMWETYLTKPHYRDFIVQRADDFAGGYLNIKNGIRQTVQDPRAGAGSPVWFFGGSTTWGYGLPDAFTYPSMFAQKTGRLVTNYGENAYTSRQSLAYLQGLYLTEPEGQRTIVFYDGINDVMHGCNPAAYSINQTAHEPRFRTVLNDLNHPFTFGRLFGQLIEFADRAATRLGLSIPGIVEYKCSDDPERAEKVAQGLVTIWENAQRLSESNGDNFIGVFQPVSFTRSDDAPVLPDHPYFEELREEFRAVYPRMIAALQDSEVAYVDLSHIYDGCPACYYDHSHVGPEAHQRLVDALTMVVP